MLGMMCINFNHWFIPDRYELNFHEFVGGSKSLSHTIHDDIFTSIYHKNQQNVGKYTIHGWYWDVHGT